jgi:PAS domain S-box-containing protein
MSNAVGSISANPTDGAAQFLKPPKLIVSSVATILVLWFVVAAWLYFGVNTPVEPTRVQTEQSDSAQQRELNEQVRRPLLVTAASGIVVWLTTAIGVIRWRRNLRRQWRITEAKSAGEVEALQRQLAESRDAVEKRAGEVEAFQKQMAAERHKAERLLRETEAQLQDRLTDLTRKLMTLGSELDQRKKYEKNLSEQRLSLESSKTVLELHVQERTLAVQQLQQRHELILNSAGDGICGLDMNGKVAFVNPAVACLTGWSREELIGKTEAEVFHGNNSAPPSKKRRGADFQRHHRTQTGSSDAVPKNGRAIAFQRRARAVCFRGVARPPGAAPQNSGVRRPAQNQVQRVVATRDPRLPGPHARGLRPDAHPDRRSPDLFPSHSQFPAFCTR